MPEKELNITIDSAGRIQYIHDDDLADLFRDQGTLQTCRASHVEPTPPPAHGEWTLDLRPVGGLVIAGFARRDDALEVERLFIEELLMGHQL